MRRTILSVLITLAVEVALAESRLVPNGPDLANLYARLSESAFVIRGTAAEVRAIPRTDLPPPVQVGPNLWRRSVTSSRDQSGTLFVVAVEKVLWSFDGPQGLGGEGTLPPSTVQILVPAGEPLSMPSKFDRNRRNRREYLLPGREYLLLLYELRGLDTLRKIYELQPGVTYYRTVEGERGAVALPDASHPEKPRDFVTPLVQAVTTFCEAVKGPDAATKIRQLQAIRDYSKDPAWQKSVDQAIYDFQNPAPRRPQP